MRPYFKKSYPSFKARLHALYPHFHSMGLTDRLTVTAQTAYLHFQEEYALKLLALIFFLLSAFLAFSLLFSPNTSSWLADELYFILLTLSLSALIWTLLRIQQNYPDPSPPHKWDTLTLYNFKSRFTPSTPHPTDNFQAPYSRYNYRYQQEGFEVTHHTKNFKLHQHVFDYQDAIDFRRGKAKINVGVVPINPHFKNPPTPYTLDTPLSERAPPTGKELLALNFQVEATKFVEFIQNKGLKPHSF